MTKFGYHIMEMWERPYRKNQQVQFTVLVDSRLFKDRKRIFENCINNMNILYYIYNNVETILKDSRHKKGL